MISCNPTEERLIFWLKIHMAILRSPSVDLWWGLAFDNDWVGLGWFLFIFPFIWILSVWYWVGLRGPGMRIMVGWGDWFFHFHFLSTCTDREWQIQIQIQRQRQRPRWDGFEWAWYEDNGWVWRLISSLSLPRRHSSLHGSGRQRNTRKYNLRQKRKH